MARTGLRSQAVEMPWEVRLLRHFPKGGLELEEGLQDSRDHVVTAGTAASLSLFGNENIRFSVARCVELERNVDRSQFRVKDE